MNKIFKKIIIITLVVFISTIFLNTQKIQAQIVPPEIKLDFNRSTNTLKITGAFNLLTNPNARDYIVEYQLARVPLGDNNSLNALHHSQFTDTVPPKIKAYKGSNHTYSEIGVSEDGKYSISFNGLNPSVRYNLRETITYGNEVKVVDFEYKTDGSGNAIYENDKLNDIDSRSYRLLAPLPGFSVFLDPDLCAEQSAQGNTNQICAIEDIVNLALEILIGLAAVSLVIRIILEGLKIMTQDTPFKIASAKGKLLDAVFGLLLVLFSYVILNTINPRLLTGYFSADVLAIDGIARTSISSRDFESITGKKILSKSEYVSLSEKISDSLEIDSCLVKATIQVESNWKPTEIGCDENVKSNSTPSRRAFLGSGIKYNGEKFNPTTNESANIFNNCKYEKDKPGFGLDWRFSKGGGLMQVTLFPENYRQDSWFQGVKEGGNNWNKRQNAPEDWKDLFDPETNIRKGIAILKENQKQCGTVEGIFRAYQTGSCNGQRDSALVNKTVREKLAYYNGCKAS